MEYIKVDNRTSQIIEYPYSLFKLVSENPNTSFPESMPSHVLEPYGIYEVIETDKPDYDTTTQTLYKSNPYCSNNQWYIDWLIRDLDIYELYSKVNYIEFWNNFIKSSLYSGIKQKASIDLKVNTVCTEFITLISEAKLGLANPEMIQSSINDLLFLLELDSQSLLELQTLFSVGNMNLVYTV